MALAFDFSQVIPHLDEPVRTNEDRLFHDQGKTMVLDRSVALQKCLEEMYAANTRACLVHFPNGIPTYRKYASLKQQKLPHVHHHAEQATPTESTPEGTEASPRSAATTPASSSVGGGRGSLCDAVHKKYLFLDMRDVLCLAVERHAEVYGMYGEKSDVPPLMQFIEAILALPVGEVANISGRNDYECGTDTETLRELLLKLETSPWVPVFSELEDLPHPKLLGIFTVTDFLKFIQDITPAHITPPPTGFIPNADPLTIFSRKRTMTPLDHWTAGAIKSATRAKKFEELHICFEDESLLDGLKLLYKTGYSAVPIVSHANPRQCMSVFSVRDLQPILLRRHAICASGAIFTMPILDYMSAVHQLESLKARYPVVHVKENATIDAVIGKILASNIRRLLLTDNAGLLTGILSVTDLGRFIARELAQKAR